MFHVDVQNESKNENWWTQLYILWWWIESRKHSNSSSFFLVCENFFYKNCLTDFEGFGWIIDADVENEQKK